MQIRGQLPAFSRYTFGTGRLGSVPYDLAADVKVARAAMDAGVWFHTSDYYGEAYKVLRCAFDENRARVPKLIVKMDAQVPESTRAVIEGTCRALGVERIDIAQMCWSADHAGIAAEARNAGPRWQTFYELKRKGLVGSFVLEIWPTPASCENGIEAVQHDLVDGCIFYYNLFERFVDNALFDLLEKRQANVLALRTFGGGHATAGTGTDPKARALESLYRKSGCRSWMEFGLRFALSNPAVKTTIAGTRNASHLQALLDGAAQYKPLDAEIVQAVNDVHRQFFKYR